MDDKPDKNSALGGWIVSGLVVLALVYVFSDKKTEVEYAPETDVSALSVADDPMEGVVGNVSSPELPDEQTLRGSIRPTPNFTTAENRTYYYLAAISDEDLKRGVRHSEALGIRYLGINQDGEDELQWLADGQSAYCRRPCKIIRLFSGKRIEANDATIIGLAFSDLSNGFIKPYENPAPKVPKKTEEPIENVEFEMPPEPSVEKID